MGKSKTDSSVHLDDLVRQAAEERARAAADAAEAAALRQAAADLLGPDGDRWTAH